MPGEAAFLGHVFAFPTAAGEAGLPILATFRKASRRAALGFGAEALAGPEALRAAFCIRRRGQSENQRHSGAEPDAPKGKLSHFLPPHSTRHARKR